jgi:glycogen debranching enzyme
MSPPQSAPANVVVPAVVTLSASSRRTLKHGDTFAMFDQFGDIVEEPLSPTGLFHKDTRHLSRLLLRLEGHRPLLLASMARPDNVVLDVDLTNPDFFVGDRLVLAKDTYHLSRARLLWEAGCYERLAVTSYAQEPLRLRIAVEFAADFADIFEIRGLQRMRRGAIHSEVLGADEVLFRYEARDGVPRATRLRFHPAPAHIAPGRAVFEMDLQRNARRSLGIAVLCDHGPRTVEGPRFFGPALRLARRSRTAARRRAVQLTTSNDTINAVLSRSAADLAMLVTDTPQGGYPYAGVPWFSTVFGRDGLITAMQTLWMNPEMARGVLHFLAAHQGQRVNPRADEEPGKILHELRESELARLGEVPFGRYFGSIDSTPLFVALAGKYWLRTRELETLEKLWPHITAALAWIDRCGDRDADGFVEYQRMHPSGLRNQGWKDSDDSVFHADGRLAEGSIALCEVQGYVYLARRMAAEMAAALGEAAFARELERRAESLRARFEDAFWCESLGTYAIALDGDKRRCEVRTSNAGQLLYTGIVGPERAATIAQAMCGNAFSTGWGIRTVAAGEPRFNPASYHNGSIWPHDNALIALGLARYQHGASALAVATAIFDAAARMHLNRLPELYCGFPRKAGKAPVLYPVACEPQAWAAAAPGSLVQACLGIEIDAGSSTLLLRRPRLPAFFDWVDVRGLQVGRGTLDLRLRRQGDTVAVTLLERTGPAAVEVLL